MSRVLFGWVIRWIPSSPNLQVLYPVLGLDSDTRLSTLIDQQSGNWNSPLIQVLFPQDIADVICGLPLSPLNKPDRLIWRGGKNGLFTVRSAYHLEVLRKEQELGESSRKGESADFWKWLWSINAPPVVKNFAWRISHGLLPTKHNLFRRQIAPDPLCPVCLTEPETLAHILWSCPSSIAVWQEGSRKVQELSIFPTDGRIGCSNYETDWMGRKCWKLFRWLGGFG